MSIDVQPRVFGQFSGTLDPSVPSERAYDTYGWVDDINLSGAGSSAFVLAMRPGLFVNSSFLWYVVRTLITYPNTSRDLQRDCLIGERDRAS
jgi:hypothetical protein